MELLMLQQLLDRIATFLHVRREDETESGDIPDDNYPMW